MTTAVVYSVSPNKRRFYSRDASQNRHNAIKGW